LCFSTASSRKAKEAASLNLQPLQSNLKVLQEQQTQTEHSMVWRLRLAKCECGGRIKFGGVIVPRVRALVSFASFTLRSFTFLRMTTTRRHYLAGMEPVCGTKERKKRRRDAMQGFAIALFFYGGAG
jgi:hypothetical protein